VHMAMRRVVVTEHVHRADDLNALRVDRDEDHGAVRRSGPA
jgi:hypothetical protein